MTDPVNKEWVLDGSAIAAARRAVMIEYDCGIITVAGRRAFCDDPKGQNPGRECFCKQQADAAVKAYLAAAPSPSISGEAGEVVERLLWSAENLDCESQGAGDGCRAAADLIASLMRERDEARGKLALLLDRVVYSDSYGVPGSDFACCLLCNGGGAPGVPLEHAAHCPVRTLEQSYEQWFDDIRATEDALRETEERAETAEREVERLRGEDWQPISMAPRGGRSIMLWITDDHPSGAAAHCFAPVSICDDGSWWDDATGDQIDPIAQATHWRPLPAHPQSAEAENG